MTHSAGYQLEDRLLAVLKRFPTEHVDQFLLHSLLHPPGSVAASTPPALGKTRTAQDLPDTAQPEAGILIIVSNRRPCHMRPEALTPLTLCGYKKASTNLEEALVNGILVEALSKENRGRPSLDSVSI
jgi:hypothetical protein